MSLSTEAGTDIAVAARASGPAIREALAAGLVLLPCRPAASSFSDQSLRRGVSGGREGRQASHDLSARSVLPWPADRALRNSPGQDGVASSHVCAPPRLLS